MGVPASNVALTDLSSLQDKLLSIPEQMADDEGSCASTLRQYDRRHYAVEFTADFGKGRVEFCGFEPGLYMHMTDATFSGVIYNRVTAPDMLRIRISTGGVNRYTPAGGEPTSLDGPCAAFIIEPAGVEPADAMFDQRQHAVHVYAERQALKILYGDAEEDLPTVLRAFINGDLTETFVRRVSLKPAMLKCLEGVHDCAHEGRTRRLYLQSMAMEILCHGFEALSDDESFGSAQASGSTLRGVIQAQKILGQRFADPPSLEDLAHDVGLSRSSLCSGFRKIVGKSIFDYIQQLRMERALVLLAQPGSSVSEVAYAVGYSYVSSFSKAVQKHFGTSPTYLRRQAILEAATAL